MNNSQLLVIFAAFIVLSITINLTTRQTVDSINERFLSRNLNLALLQAKNLYEEIRLKSFDEKLISISYLNKDSLTSSNSLGSENETRENYDDVDDYNNLIVEFDSDDGSKVKLVVKVEYVREDNPEQVSYVPTFLKRVKIYCFDNSQNQLFELKQIFSVW